MSKSVKMSIDGKSFKRMDDPIEGSNSRSYSFYVKVENVAEGIPMATNPRDQKLTSSVARDIEESLVSNDGRFHSKNRGIVLSAGKVFYNNKKNEVTIYFDDDFDHGNIDGGHTYKIVLKHKDEKLNQFIKFEVLTGVEDIIVDLAEARNNSVQVDEKSLAELIGKFDPIKEGIEGLPFFSRIAFKQNQVIIDPKTGKKLKMIDAREIVSIISMFNVEAYPADKHPIQAYSSKAKMLENYLVNPDYYSKFVNIMPEIFDLFDDIESEFADAYNSTGGRYGTRKYSQYKNGNVVGTSKFNENDLTYKVPDGIVYPVLAAFRALLDYDDESEKYYFKKEPKKVWEDVKVSMARKIMDFASSIGDNPNAVGKDSNIWGLAYMTILIEGLK